MPDTQREGAHTTLPRHRSTDSSKTFDEIVNGVELATPCEARLEEMCGVAAREAHFMVSFKRCAHGNRQVMAFCEPCMEDYLAWPTYVSWCGDVYSPPGEAFEQVVRIRS